MRIERNENKGRRIRISLLEANALEFAKAYRFGAVILLVNLRMRRRLRSGKTYPYR